MNGIKVVINGEVKEIPREVSFEELTHIAFPDLPRTETVEWEITYSDPENPRAGESQLFPGQTLGVNRGMEIHVAHEDKS